MMGEETATVSFAYHRWLTRPQAACQEARPRPKLRTGGQGRRSDEESGWQVSQKGAVSAHRPGPSGGFLLLGIQVLHVLLDPRQLEVATRLLALPGGEAVGEDRAPMKPGRGWDPFPS